MSKKRLLPVTLSVLLLLPLTFCSSINEGRALWVETTTKWPWVYFENATSHIMRSLGVRVTSLSNETHNSNDIILDALVSFGDSNDIISLNYSTDHHTSPLPMALNATPNICGELESIVNLPGFSPGNHWAMIYGVLENSEGTYYAKSFIQFIVLNSYSTPIPSNSAKPPASWVPSPLVSTTFLPSPYPSPTLTETSDPTNTRAPVSLSGAHTSTPQNPLGFFGTSIPTQYGYVIVAVLVALVTAGMILVYSKRIRK
jgi:hypothetical protein